MNFSKIENLVILSKKGDTEAKEELVGAFTPFILNLSKKSYVNGFEFEDLKNECYKTLFKCVQLYNPDRHRFVAYATNAIKNNINHLIRVSIRRDDSEGPKTLTLDDTLEHVLFCDMDFIDDKLCKTAFNRNLITAINQLTNDEQQLIVYVFFKGYTLKGYATFTGISYNRAITMKFNVLNKMKRNMKREDYLM
ncbi:sigma-70 family RNA polymerase sigma factor [Clostridium sp.]|uniref:sigma-70 family RNA polymerase sigma factor n=1 Tax=Clostridium sp. TaxID=1506 RepID=UPI002FCBF7AF